MTDNIDKIREFFAEDKFATATTGIEIEEAEDGYSRCLLKLNDNHKNLFGDVMGGVLFTLADFAFAVATNSPGHYTTTLSSEIRSLTRAKGDHLYAECRVVKDGEHACFADVVITDGLDRKAALVSVSGLHLS